MRVTLLSKLKNQMVQKAQKKQRQQLIDYQCKYSLSRINPSKFGLTTDALDTKYLIVQICKRYDLPYNRQLGFICAHISFHYNPFYQKHYNDLQIAEQIFQTFYHPFFLSSQQLFNRQYFLKPKVANQVNNNFHHLQQLLQFGKQCLSSAVMPKYKEFLEIQGPFEKQYRGKVESTILRFLRSLHFQHIPGEYSNLLIQIYLEKGQLMRGKQMQWLQKNRQKFYDIDPYHNFFQIMSSLVNYVAMKKNPISFDHFLDICSNAHMGVVEWPIVLSNRVLFQLPLKKESVY